MDATNWFYGENYERVFAVLEGETDRFEKAKASCQSVRLENVTDKFTAKWLKSLIEPYTIGFGFNTFQVHSDAYFDLEIASAWLPASDGSRLITEIDSQEEVGLTFLLNRVCDDFLRCGSAWIDTDLESLEIQPEIYKQGFSEINVSVFKQAVFQSLLEYYWCGQTYRETEGMLTFLEEIQIILQNYQADTYFIRSKVFGEERYSFFACYSQTSPWKPYFPYQTTFFAIDRKLKQIHVFVFAQNND